MRKARSTDLHALCDARRLRQLLDHLLSNAVKFGEGKEVELGLERRGQDVRFSVRDHGIGIAPEDVSRIFDRFERAASARHFSGFGLGLTIVKQIVDALGGTIAVQSRPGAGSEFIVDLPLLR